MGAHIAAGASKQSVLIDAKMTLSAPGFEKYYEVPLDCAFCEHYIKYEDDESGSKVAILTTVIYGWRCGS